MDLDLLIIILYIFCQVTYSITFLIELYFITLPINWVNMDELSKLKKEDYPFIVLFYPVLRESKETMFTTFKTLAKIKYPKDKYRIISIPNSNDLETIRSLEQLQQEFHFLEIMKVPPTSDDSWQIVWDYWESNKKVYWWHEGIRAHITDLPPKKTRQLIYAFYHIAKDYSKTNCLLNYIDADSCLPPDHFLAGAVGITQYDILQATNIAANLNDSMAASRHSFDHMLWDGLKYPHLSANGKHPYWVLGKGTFIKVSDLVELGGFHPWTAIEDPELGIRFWMNGKRLGIIEKPIIEEAPITTMAGFIQRKRWVCGFFQALDDPLIKLGMTPYQKILTWINFLPNLYLWINLFGLPTGIWAAWGYFHGVSIFPLWVIILSIINIISWFFLMFYYYYNTWKRTSLVRDNLRERIWYMIRMNPIMAMIWWVMWLIPLIMGFRMYLGEGGLVWERTQKSNANFLLFKYEWGNWFKKKQK